MRDIDHSLHLQCQYLRFIIYRFALHFLNAKYFFACCLWKTVNIYCDNIFTFLVEVAERGLAVIFIYLLEH